MYRKMKIEELKKQIIKLLMKVKPKKEQNVEWSVPQMTKIGLLCSSILIYLFWFAAKIIR